MALCYGITYWRRIVLHCMMIYVPAIRTTKMCRLIKENRSMGSAQKRTVLSCYGIEMSGYGKADPFNVGQWHRIAHYGIGERRRAVWQWHRQTGRFIGIGQQLNAKAVLGIPILRDAKVEHIIVIHRNSNPLPMRSSGFVSQTITQQWNGAPIISLE